jgi:AcrR family transcriptional regulator
VIGTAATEAVTNPIVRAEVATVLSEVDEAYENRIREALEKGELPADADPVSLARLASAVLHSLAVRARAGEKRRRLQALADAAVDLICG